MKPLTRYYVRSRQRSNQSKVSAWSPTASFTTKDGMISGTEVQKLLASDGKATDYFGWSLAISNDGTTALVGAYMTDDTASNSGSVYVYTRVGTTWVYQTELHAGDPQATDYFGYSVALSADGNVAAVGAYMEDQGGSNAGAVYIYNRVGTTWTQFQKFIASGSTASAYFGYSLSFNSTGTTLLIGAYNANATKGQAYLFMLFAWGWAQLSTLLPNDPVNGVMFGSDVALSADGLTAFVGAYGVDTGKTDAGAVYVFSMPDPNNIYWWTQNAKFQAPTVTAKDAFGRCLALSYDGTVLAVGAYNTVAGSDTSGSVYIFTKTAGVWTAKYKLTASDRTSGDYFGQSIAINATGTALIVGAYADDNKGTDSGSVYLFKSVDGVWSFVKKITASDGQATDYFGSAVAMSGDGMSALVGAYLEDGKASNAGAVYAFI